MRKFLILVLALSTMACSLTVRIGNLEKPNTFIQITYAYEFTDSGGTNVEVVAEQSVENPSFSFNAGENPSVQDIQKRVLANPVGGISLNIVDTTTQTTVNTATDSSGHASFNVDFKEGEIFVNGGWSCHFVMAWTEGGDNVTKGGAIWTCSKYIAPPQGSSA